MQNDLLFARYEEMLARCGRAASLRGPDARPQHDEDSGSDSDEPELARDTWSAVRARKALPVGTVATPVSRYRKACRSWLLMCWLLTFEC